jgi:hypothetical protein
MIGRMVWWESAAAPDRSYHRCPAQKSGAGRNLVTQDQKEVSGSFGRRRSRSSLAGSFIVPPGSFGFTRPAGFVLGAAVRVASLAELYPTRRVRSVA